jgi:cysteine-S-conjugate beta-lyase
MSFDSILNRRGSGSIKWDRRPDLDPFWVADMDFQSPEPIREAVRKAAEFGVFGYAHAHATLNEAILQYIDRRHGVVLPEKQIIHHGGLVVALSLAARAFGEKGDSLMTCTPVYPPFIHVASDAKMETIKIDHCYVNGRWTFDFEKMEAEVTERTKLFILCNPQNPLGRNFTKDEVIKVAEFCKRHDLVLISDEIHCDLVLNEEEQPFFSALNLPDTLREKLIVLQAPSKTYNIAGMGYAFAIIENDSIRRQYEAAKGHTVPEINCIAFYAAEAAYRHCEPWRLELLDYLRKNRDTVDAFVRSEMPEVIMPKIEATYLAWMDCTSLEYCNPASHLEKNSKIFVSDGAFFGSPRCVRFNFGCSNARVLEGLEKLRKGFFA